MSWKWLIIPGWKSHAVPVYMEHAVVEDLQRRTPEEVGSDEPLTVESKYTTSCFIDEPGMVAMDRPTTVFVIDGLSITIPCEDVATMAAKLERAKPRTFETGGLAEGLSYYKLHGFCKCIVLTPDQRYLLLEQLHARVAECELQASAFYATRKTPGEALREANASALGIPVEDVPDIGGHKHDRFRARVGKKADA